MSDYLNIPNNLKDITVACLLFIIEAVFISEQMTKCRIGAKFWKVS